MMDFNIKEDDLFLIGDMELEQKGLVHHHISSANDLYEIGLSQIITRVFEIDLRIDKDNVRRNTDEEKNINYIQTKVTFDNVTINKPTTHNHTSGKDDEPIFPNEAILNERTYKSTMRMDIKIVATAYMNNGTTHVREDVVKNYRVCRIPILVKSKLCNTYGLSKEALAKLHEDPSDPGGYFIIKGVEWVIDNVENILFNKVRVFKNEGYKKELIRAEFISKPGDFYLNSDEFLVRYLNDGQLTIEIYRNKLKDIHIPFYLVFRVLGWNTDKQIMDNVLYDYDSPTSKNIRKFLEQGFNAKYAQLGDARHLHAQVEVLQYMTDYMKDRAFAYLNVDAYQENYQKIMNTIRDHFDVNLLPHIGTKPSSRERKMRFLCMVIRKVFLVYLGNMQPTDRDSYNSKRVSAAGVNFAKSIKTNFSATIVQQIQKAIRKNFRTMSFFQIDLGATIKSSIYIVEFERAITQAITAGSKSEITLNKRKRVNRLSSRMLNRKNQLNTYVTLRLITISTGGTQAKQSARDNEMRRVHPSTIGYVCLTDSPEGEKVGLNKQLALFAFITRASYSEVIKYTLLEDADVIPLNNVNYRDIATGLCNIFVNGDWIGCCKDALALAQKYRHKRRRLEISPEITIAWDNTLDEVYFWADVGRMIRPLLIVYNNKRDPDKFPVDMRDGPFVQWLAITQKHIDMMYAKTITTEDLLREGVIEYISAEEQENMLLAPRLEILQERMHDELMQYTHCDIPQAIIGITPLTSTFASHNQGQRIVYQCLQSKQTCGVFTKNWPYRATKDMYLQYNNETPIVRTLYNRYMDPNGSNCVVALMCYTSFNVEDSLILNKGAVDKGLFNICKFTIEKTDLEPQEIFANPDVTNTMDIKTAHYDKLHNGIIKKGTIVHKNDALIGKLLKITKNADDKYQYADRSIIYKSEEPAIVHNVIEDRNEDGEKFCKVVLRKARPVMIGDKFCMTGDHEVLTSTGWIPIRSITVDDLVATLDRATGVLCWQHPTDVYAYRHDGSMYQVDVDAVSMCVTLNHRLYYSVTDTNAIYAVPRQHKHACFSLQAAVDVMCSSYTLCNAAINAADDKANYIQQFIDEVVGIDMSVGHWLDILGVFLVRKRLAMSGLTYDLTNLSSIMMDAFTSALKDVSNDDMKVLNSVLLNMPIIMHFITGLCVRSARMLIQILRLVSEDYMCLDPKCVRANGLVSDRFPHIKCTLYHDGYVLGIYDILRILTQDATELHVTPDMGNVCDDYNGDVYCLSVPNEVFMVRRHHTYHWTGNSSRAGQKGTVGLLLNEADMPRTEEGIAPAIIMNPMSIPSRMTVGPLIESLVSNLCAHLGTQIDSTIFKRADIAAISAELERVGLNKYGYRRLYSGITGEYIDCEIFMGPTYYQRLQKLTYDANYAIAQGPSDCITYQPLDGQSSSGGLRIGEMERDCIVTHGAAKFMAEKFFAHSDGYTEYVCRCGKPAIYNERKGIYKCNYCKDNADIVAYPTSWSSKLLMQEMETMNVGIRRQPDPFCFTVENEPLFKHIDDMCEMKTD